MSIRAELAKRYLTGTGLELGAGTNPTPVGAGVNVTYADKRSHQELKAYFVSDNVTVGTQLEALEKGGLDFLMAHHVLEHCSNVLEELARWISYLKDEGVLFLSVPNRTTCGDRSRLPTPPTHFISDYIHNVDDNSFESREHIFSFLWGWCDEGALQGKSKQESHELVAAAARSLDNDLHWHVFTYPTFIFVTRVAAALAGRTVEFLHVEDGRLSGDEHRIVARLTPMLGIDGDIQHIKDLKGSLAARVFGVTLKFLDGVLLDSKSKEDAGKLLVAKDGKASWIRDNEMLRELNLANDEPVTVDLNTAGVSVYGPELSSTPIQGPAERRDAVRARVPLREGRGLEISPGATPLISKAEGNIRYCDRFSSSEFRAQYSSASAVEVDVVLGEKLVDEVLEKGSVDYIVASHVLEHIPDFVQFFISARNILRPGGVVVMLVPDRRYTFDVLRKCSTIEEIEEAHAQRLRRPSSRMLEDFYLNVDRGATAEGLWSGRYRPRPSHSPDEASNLLRTLDHSHVDTHCWTFTPESYRELIDHVIARYVPSMAVCEITSTNPPENEFLVHLQVQ
jgi:predicted SAM-dependent methyltransferase